MSEVIIRLNNSEDAISKYKECPNIRLKIKGGVYVQDFVRCQDCRYWVYNFNGCKRNPCTEPWYAEDGCTYGERDE